ncbi:MAG: hypothetical protein GXY33_05155 [Phycisphaerae bacterium]|nr:hypothetical protein [Phycisphaerae bacterium]
MSTNNKKTFVGFGFGPIQSALFLYEAYRSGNFSRFVVSEIDQALVDAVRANDGRYAINIARKDRIDQFTLEGIELYNPRHDDDRKRIIAAIAESDEMATALPSVKIYSAGGETGVVGLLAAGLAGSESVRPKIIYAAENHNHAAEVLMDLLIENAPAGAVDNVQTLNTVIGKMSGVIADQPTIQRMNLATITPSIDRAILVEEFNRILVSRVTAPGYRRGIDVFIEKPDLLPFEEAKLYGHNAIHALIAYLADLAGLDTVAQAAGRDDIMAIARQAFIDESGAALIRRHQSLGDPLFTADGYRDYADDLLERMVNPNLNDLVARVGRDHVRKLGYDDRLYGTMHLALQYGVKPTNLALGAAAGVVSLIRRKPDTPQPLPLPDSPDQLTEPGLRELLLAIWKDGKKLDDHGQTMIEMTWNALQTLIRRGIPANR